VESAQAAVAKARLDLTRTEVRAPIDGVTSQTDRLAPGAMAMQMLGNVSIVGGGAPWIEANFKETQLAKIRQGQLAEVKIDAIPGRSFKAHVTGIGAGTGSEFSVLPAQNATGNWVKVTQRVPVRLTFDEVPDKAIVSGWSAHVTVQVKD
jgi:membrane fusion protein (multidrug efflux system)